VALKEQQRYVLEGLRKKCEEHTTSQCSTVQDLYDTFIAYKQYMNYNFFLLGEDAGPPEAQEGHNFVEYFYAKIEELRLDDPNRALTLSEKLMFQGGELLIFQAARKTKKVCLR
jgi:hypothetical protein